MSKKNLSRRDFLKLTLTSLGATFLAACGCALGIPRLPPPPSHRSRPVRTHA
jgi:hypothetical protein